MSEADQLAYSKLICDPRRWQRAGGADTPSSAATE